MNQESNMARRHGVEFLKPRRRMRYYLHAADVAENSYVRAELMNAASTLASAGLF